MVEGKVHPRQPRIPAAAPGSGEAARGAGPSIRSCVRGVSGQGTVLIEGTTRDALEPPTPGSTRPVTRGRPTRGRSGWVGEGRARTGRSATWPRPGPVAGRAGRRDDGMTGWRDGGMTGRRDDGMAGRSITPGSGRYPGPDGGPRRPPGRSARPRARLVPGGRIRARDPRPGGPGPHPGVETIRYTPCPARDHSGAR